MPNTLIKIFKVLFLGLVPMLLISNRHQEIELPAQSGESFSFHSNNLVKTLDTSSDVEIKANTFDMPDGKSSLELELLIQEDGEPYTISLFISGVSQSAERFHKKYTVAPIEGFLSDFSGIFGVVNIDSLGEKPFFSKTGNIELVAMANDRLKANLNMQFSNEKGKTITIYGEFNTIKDVKP